MNAADIADWWDAQREKSRDALDAFIEQNPNLFGIVVAGSANTAMDVAASTVDSLRLGTGMAEKTPGGFIKDSLRLLNLAAPLVKAGSVVKSAAETENVRLAKAIVDPGSEVCGWVSATQALVQVGFKPASGKLFVAVEDLVRLIGRAPASPHFGEMIPRLREIGAAIRPIRNVSSFDEVANMTPKNGGVVMFSVEGKGTEVVEGRLVESTIGHALYAFRDGMGRVRIMDRGGVFGQHSETYESLTQLTSKYGLLADFVPKQAAVLENVSAKVMGKKEAILAIAAALTTLVRPRDVDTFVQAFEIFKMKFNGQPVPSHQEPHTVVATDTLQSLAKKYYGDETKWAVLYEANRALIDKPGHGVPANQKIVIPDLPHVGAARPADNPAQLPAAQDDSKTSSDKPKGTPVEPTPPAKRKRQRPDKDKTMGDPTPTDRD